MKTKKINPWTVAAVAVAGLLAWRWFTAGPGMNASSVAIPPQQQREGTIA
jgi:hypothetical protein